MLRAIEVFFHKGIMAYTENRWIGEGLYIESSSAHMHADSFG